jgi:hypothetical protein
MDDFLHNLRKNTDRNYDKRRQNPQYRGPERRGLRDQQQHRPFQKRPDTQDVMVDMVAETIPEIKALLVKMEEGQKRMIEVFQRDIEVQERQAVALEAISNALKQSVELSPVVMAVPKPEVPAIGAEKAADPQVAERTVESSSVERDSVVGLIIELRDGGMTYKEIADRLQNDQVPTFSGKGEWHAQTVHKVCRKGV